MLPAISDPESLTTPAGLDGPEPAIETLSSPQRQAILQYLEGRASPASVAELAEHLTLEDRDDGALASCGDALLGTRRRVQISLRHNHVPKLAAIDAVAFDRETNAVTLSERGSELLARLESAE